MKVDESSPTWDYKYCIVKQSGLDYIFIRRSSSGRIFGPLSEHPDVKLMWLIENEPLLVETNNILAQNYAYKAHTESMEMEQQMEYLGTVVDEKNDTIFSLVQEIQDMKLDIMDKRKHILDLKEKHQAMKEEGYEYIKRTHQLQVDVENLNKTTLDMKKQLRALHAEHAKLSSRHDVVNNALRTLVKIPEAISTLQQQINMNLSNKNYRHIAIKSHQYFYH